MPTIYREFPPELTAALAAARRFHEFAWEAGPEKGTTGTVRIQMFGGFLTTLFEHHDSTVLLLETGKNNASGFALARLLVEAFYRGLWLLRCAPDSQVEAVRNGGSPYPKFIEMTEAVDRTFGNTGKFQLEGELWGALCGFTHTGSEQLSRRFDAEGNLFPQYSLEEVLQVLISATQLLATMSQGLCIASGRSEDAGLISKRYKELFGSN